MTDIRAQELADRYIALWLEPDAEQRRKAVQELWAEDGEHVLQPPQEIRQIGYDLGFDATTLEARGHEAIETRVTRSYERFVAGGQFVFRAKGDAVRLRDVVTFHWESVNVGGGGAVTGGGLEVLMLDEDGRIVTDYMFPS
ncbi:hypothetical protein [Nonomuraea sp. NPDC003727]